MPSPKIGGGFLFRAFPAAVEIGGTLETAGSGYVCDHHIGGGEELLCILDSTDADIFGRAQTKMRSEQATDILRAYPAADLAEIIQSYFFGEMARDIVYRFRNGQTVSNACIAV